MYIVPTSIFQLSDFHVIWRQIIAILFDIISAGLFGMKWN